MTARADIDLEPLASPHLRELDDALLLVDVLTPEGAFAAGTIGTVVHAYNDGTLFEVEVSLPACAVLTLRADQITGVR